MSQLLRRRLWSRCRWTGRRSGGPLVRDAKLGRRSRTGGNGGCDLLASLVVPASEQRIPQEGW